VDNKPYECLKYPDIYNQLCDKRLKIIKTYLSLKDKILDAGCGGEKHPYCFLELKKIFPGIIGIDLNGQWHPDIIVQDIKSMSFKDNEFDISLCMSTLEHIKEWEKALNELVRVTKKRIIIVIPTTERRFYHFFANILRKIIGVNNPIFVGHHREYFPSQIINFNNKKIKLVKMEKKLNCAALIFKSLLRKTKMYYTGIYIIELKSSK
jgi:SAM-dependent methyltransferase